MWTLISRPQQPQTAPEPDKLRDAGAASEDEPDVVYENAYFTMMSRPWFSFGWAFIVFLMWLLFHWQTQEGLAGAETIWPGKTRLQIVDVEECEDYRGEIWRWWTHQLSHANLSHVLVNCLMLIVFGVPLEGWHGTLRMFLMFQVGVFVGAMCFLVWDNHGQVVGMSGGCYALIGMHFGDMLMNYKDKKYRVTKVVILVILFVLGMLQAVVDSSSNISHTAHFGGFIAGFIICTFIGYNPDVEVWETVIRVVAGVVGIALIIFCLAWGLADWAPRELQDPVRWCWLRQVISPANFSDDQPHCVRCGGLDCIARWNATLNARIDVATCFDQLGGFAVSE